jgi:hypothetical protein
MMRRKPILPWLRVAVAAAAWVATVVAVEAAESEISRPAHQLEQRIELQLQLMERARDVPPLPDSPPDRSHEESFEPWELVGV